MKRKSLLAIACGIAALTLLSGCYYDDPYYPAHSHHHRGSYYGHGYYGGHGHVDYDHDHDYYDHSY